MTDLHDEAERLANIVQRVDAPFAHKVKVAGTLRELSARLAEVERERDAALNQLDSERHSLEVLERRAAQFMAERDEARARVAAAYKEAARQARRRAEIYDEGNSNNAISDVLWGLVVRLETLARPEETDALVERDARIREDAFRQGFNAGITAGRNLQEIKDEPPAAIREDKT